jgi:hypothetical protein
VVVKARHVTWTFPAVWRSDAAPGSRRVHIQTTMLRLEADSRHLPPLPAGHELGEDPRPMEVLCRMAAGMHPSIGELALGTDADGLPLRVTLHPLWGSPVNDVPVDDNPENPHVCRSLVPP